MTYQRLIRHVVLGVLVSLLLAALTACQPAPTSAPTATAPVIPSPTASPAPTPLPEPVLVKVNLGRPPQTLDPALTASPDADPAANDLVDNLFIGLTTLDPDTGRVEPALARSWEQTDDGLTWIVHLRDDVFWVSINPATGQMERMRPVTAGDVVAAVRRACRADTHAPLAQAAFVIQGCREVNLQDPAALTPAFIEQTLGARVLNDITVEFKLTANASFFPTVLAMPLLRPIPPELIESAGEGWTQPGAIWTSGPYTVQPGIPPEEGYTLIASQFWPLDRPGNVEIVQIGFDPALGPDSDMWQTQPLGLTTIPRTQLTTAPIGDDPAYWLMAQPAAMFIAFSYETPPFDRPEVRRALALALDRQALIDGVLEPLGLSGIPALSIAPPGTAGAPSYGEVGVTYDPQAARAALASAGYANCAGMPPVTLLTGDSDVAAALAERYIELWQQVLGCGPETFTLQQDSLLNVVSVLRQRPADRQPARPGLIALGWQADYPDAQHWLAGLWGCRDLFPTAYFDQGRACSDADQWLAEAATLQDQDERARLYRQVEEAFFSPSGEMPLIPVYFWARPLAIQPWLEVAPLRAGSLRFDRWVADTTLMP
jgi:oligopeptide transport system substrate-binding protein